MSSSCCAGKCGCGSACKCGSSCTGCQMYPDMESSSSERLVLGVGVGPNKSWSDGTEETAAENGGCKCNPCTCDPCTCK